jgi:phytoene desaturase
MTKKVVIIGAGFGGLSSAAYLAKAGYQVTILEKNDQVGGRASVWEKDGFVFDLGPSWYLMPDVFDAFFSDFGKTTSDYYQTTRLDPAYRIFFSKTNHIDISKDLKKNIALFDQLEPDGGKKLQEYLKVTGKYYHTAMEKFVYKDLSGITDLFDPTLIKEVGSLKQLLTSFDSFVSRYFTSDEAKKILEYVIVFLGGNPNITPALYSILSYVDMELGVWYPQGGFGAVPQGMARLCEELGVEIHLNQEVTGFEISNHHITNVHTKSSSFETDFVVSNADYQFTETQLLDPEHQTYNHKYWDSRVMAPSALLIYLGLSTKVPKLAHHTLVLAHDWMTHFDSIFKNPGWPDDPSYYVCTSSKTDATVAPKGSENIFILVPVASDLDDAESIRKPYAQKIIEHLSELIDFPIDEHIQVKRLFSHQDFTSRYHAYKGTALGLAHTLKQTAIFRPRITSKKVHNLRYAGGYVHPGIGTAPSLISGKIAAESIA